MTRGSTAYYRSECECQDLTKLQVRDEIGHLRWLPRWLLESVFEILGRPAFVITLHWEVQIKTRIKRGR